MEKCDVYSIISPGLSRHPFSSILCKYTNLLMENEFSFIYISACSLLIRRFVYQVGICVCLLLVMVL